MIGLDFTFLRKDQVAGDHILDIIQKYGLECDASDFAILMGGMHPIGRNLAEWFTKTFELSEGVRRSWLFNS